MINSRVALFLLLGIPSYLISQTFLDRFRVPIYISSSLSTGYGMFLKKRIVQIFVIILIVTSSLF